MQSRDAQRGGGFDYMEDGGWGGGKGEESYVTFSFLSQSGIIRCVHLSRCARLLLDLTEEGGR